MNRPPLLTTTQGWSRLLGAMSTVPVACAVVMNWEFSRQAAARDAVGAFVCGTGAIALLLACMAVACALSSCAVALGVFSYLRAPKPRPVRRRIELIAVGNFFVLALLAYAVMLAGKVLG